MANVLEGPIDLTVLPKRFLAKVLEVKIWAEAEFMQKKVQDAFDYGFIAREAWRYHCFNALHPDLDDHANAPSYHGLAEHSDDETDDELDDEPSYVQSGEGEGFLVDDNDLEPIHTDSETEEEHEEDDVEVVQEGA